MPTYTIQRDPPWVPERASAAPTAPSIYSDDDHEDMPDANASGAPPLKYKGSYHPSYHAHPQQQINDFGPQVRQSRLPIFKQVRSMLHKPPPLTTPGNPKWDEYTGELSDTGKPSHVQPSTYVSPWEGAFQARRRSPDRPNKLRKNPSPERLAKSQRSPSPVSILEDEIKPTVPLKAGRQNPQAFSPVSPVSPLSPIHDEVPPEDHDLIPGPLSANVRRPQQQQTAPHTPVAKPQIKRKPAPRSTSTTENQPPSPPSAHQKTPSQSSDMDARMIDDKDAEPEPQQPTSHFSWTTYAPSIVPAGRASTDTMPSMRARMSKPPSVYPEVQEDPHSRFSWSTVNTNMKPDSPPPSPPPPIPTKYTSPPMQSILSRQRPIKRTEREEWAPPPSQSRERAAGGTPRTARPGDASGSATPTSATTASTKTGRKLTAHPNSSTKALPPPPSLSPANKLTHLESLLARERDLQLQRRNVEKAIMELEKIEKASPLDVPFATVREAKRRLLGHRVRLAEVQLEEREVGVLVSRARRKEGEEEGLWVRRVTG